MTFVGTGGGNAAGRSPKASGTGGKGGGGGGGGGKEEEFKPVETMKQSKPVEDRYSNIQSRIDKIARSLERLSDAADDAWGAQKIRNLKAINAQLQA